MEWQNFSAAYALAFCAGVYSPARLAWWLPLTTLAVTDVLINAYYYFWKNVDSFQWTQLFNYIAYAAIIWMGSRMSPKLSWARLVGGGLMGALLFYFITNTASWFFNPFHNPEYTKSFAGWLIALTKGTAGWPQTWEFLRNTLLSGGLFTGLFVGAMKMVESAETEPEAGTEAEEKSEGGEVEAKES